MPRAPKKPTTNPDLIPELERAIRSVLTDPNASLSERIQAINAGTRLATARYKIAGDEKEGSFFN
jgi:hypothetical protein